MRRSSERVIYYRDPLNDDFAGGRIQTRPVTAAFPYVHRSLFWKAASAVVYNLIAMPVVYVICKLYLGVKIKNRQVLRKIRGGVFLYGNHTRALDAFLPALVSFPRPAYVVANPDAVSIPGLKHLVQMIGCIPLPTELGGMAPFLEAVELRCRQGSAVGIFPEAHIWPFYTGIRPFRSGSFRYPVRMNTPAVAMVVTYRKRRGLFRLARRPGMTVTLSEPFYPDATLSARAAQEKLRRQVYEFMCSVSERNENVAYIRYVQTE